MHTVQMLADTSLNDECIDGPVTAAEGRYVASELLAKPDDDEVFGFPVYIIYYTFQYA